MKRLLVAGLVGMFALPGCVVAVEHREHRYHPPPPPPPPPAAVTVEWHDSRAVVLREYYDCDWDTVGAFEYYEDTCGIPEDDLFFLLHVSRVTGRNFHHVVYTYGHCNRNLWNVCVTYRIDPWGLYVDLPRGTVCPPAYSRVYGYYWRRDRAIVLTNYDCHALFWLRFSVNYYGWRPQECFTRWDHCVDTRVRYVTVVNREYVNYAGRGGRTWNYGQMKKVDRDVTVIQKQRTIVRTKVSNDVKLRETQGEQTFRPPPRQEIDNHRRDHDRREQEERARELEERKKAPRHYGEGPKNDPKHDPKDDRKDDLKNEKRTPPPPPPKKGPPPPPKKDERQDDRKDNRDDRQDDRKNPPPPPPKKDDDGKKDGGPEDRRDDRQDDRDDRRDERKAPPPPPKKDAPPPPPKKKDAPPPPKNDDGKKNGGKDQAPPPPPKKDAPPPKKENPPPPKDNDNGKKEDGNGDNGKKDDGGKKNDDQKKQQVPPKRR